MSSKKFQAPAYLHHKARNKGRSRVNGKDIYFPGPYDSKQSREAYRELVAKLAAEHRKKLARGRGAEILKGECLVVELTVDYLKHVDEYYSASNEPSSIRYALRPLTDLYGRLGVDEITPKKLKDARDVMIAKGWSRTGINKAASRILKMFRWAVAEEFVQVTTYQALKTVEPLKYGRCGDVRETKPVQAVDDADIDAIKKHVLPEVWAMIQLQRFSGMRPSEVCQLKGEDITREKEVWIYKPTKHKNAWRRKERIVFLGPTCQRALLPFLQADPTAYIFSPRRAMERRREERERKAPPKQGNRTGYSKRTREGRPAIREPGEMYTAHSYRRAVQRGCDDAGIDRWTPYQIRHAKAQEVRTEYGIEGASAALGNSIEAAQIYAERNLKLAREVAAKCG